MPAEVISIIVLVLVFLIATVTSVHMGALALFAAFVVALAVAGETADDVFGGFPGDLFVVLVGVTYLFALAKNNGTVDWLVQAAVRAVRGRIALIPWVMFGVTAAMTAAGAVVPAAVAIVAPIGLGFALRHRINPVLMGLLIINGEAPAASPRSASSAPSPTAWWTAAAWRIPAAALRRLVLLQRAAQHRRLLHVRRPLLLGRREGFGAEPDPAGGGPSKRNGRRSARLDYQAGGAFVAGPRPGSPTAEAEQGGAGSGSGTATATEAEPGTGPVPFTRDCAVTVTGILALAVGALAFDLDVGLMAISVAVVLTLLSPRGAKGVVNQVAWPTVLLICGIVTYVSLMERMGTIDFLGESVAGIGVPLLAALLICLIGGAVSAFASTTGILGALIPLAVPFLLAGEVGAVGMITALALSSSVVDSSPFSTSGALVVASSPEHQRDLVFRRLMQWGMSMILVAPLITWGFFVVPGWL
ncbi:hypothetical protein ACFQXA_14190 [Nocardiopsis composta]